MLVYVILVDFIFRRVRARLPALHLRRDPALEVVHEQRLRRVTSVVGQERLIKQIHFPKIVLPVAATWPGIVELRLRADPAVRAAAALLPAPDLARTLVLIPAIAAVQFVFTLAFCVAARRRSTSSSATSATSPATSCGSGSTCRRPSTRSSSVDARCASNPPIGGALMQLNPFDVALRVVPERDLRRTPRPDWLHARRVLLGVSLVLLALATLLFKRLEPAFAKVL